MKKLKRFLSVALVLCMLLSVVPFGIFAAGDTEEQSTGSDFYKILHLDCGRKYFTKDWIIALINEMAADGYNQLQLAFGNDGLRFLLDDMSFTANGTTYSHEDVVSAVEAGNASQNSSGDSRWLTQAEMDEIIEAANAKSIEIVPLLNLPGHANALLDIAGDSYNYSSSQNTLDVTNTSAVNFAYALFTKYVDYFAGKNCEFFNFGADEFANDIYANSFAGLNQSGYNSFVSFINKLAGYIKDKNMTPRAFNDGLYYGSYSSVSIDTNIQCCYWSSGWSGYNVASPATIATKGHDMINTNGAYYYVLGKSDNFDSGYNYALNFDNTVFSGTGNTISNPVGSMFCIWCDYPNAETETEIAENIRLTLRAMEARMDDESIDNLDESVVSGGFNADGSINTDSSGSGTTITIQKDGKNVSTFSVEMGGTATLSLSDSEAIATWSSSNENVATVSVVARSVEANSVTVTPVGEGTATITATLSDGTDLTAEVTVIAAGTSGEPEFDKVIELEVGEEKQEQQEDVNNEENVDKSLLNTSIASVTVKGETTEGTPAVEESFTIVISLSAGTYIIGNGTQWLTWNGTTLGYTTDASQATQWTITQSGNSWTIKSGNYYLRHNNNKLSASTNTNSTTWSYSGSTGFYYTSGAMFGSTYYLRWSGSAWQVSTTNSNNGAAYTYTPGQDAVEGTAYTTITFKGVHPGTTYVTVGGIIYKIIVNYKTETINAVIDQETTVPVSGDADTSKLDTSIATVSISGGTMTVTGKSEGETEVTVGDTIYTITVTKEDLSVVTPLTVEYWITNAQVTPDTKDGVTVSSGTGTNAENESYTYNYSQIAASSAYSEGGAEFSSLVSSTGTGNGNPVVFWKGRVLTGSKQDNSDGCDYTLTESNAADFQFIRYYNGSWSYSNDGATWTDVPDGAQVVAYYLQKTTVTQAVDTLVKDWGFTKDDSYTWFGWASSWALSFAAVYDTGMEPSESDLINTTTFYNGDPGRNVGYITFTNTDDYEVYKVTATYGTRTASSSSKSVSYNLSSNTTETIVWKEGDSDVAYVNGDEHECCAWDSDNSAILIRIYVREKVREDTLNIIYKLTDGTEFYSLNVNTKAGNDFNGYVSGGELVKNTIENSVGNTQTITTDLKDTTNLPNMPAKYKSGNYVYEYAEVSEDNKTLYLIYRGNNTKTFVYDFGLPLEISAEDLVENPDDVTQITANDSDKCTVLSSSENSVTVQVNSATVTSSDFTVTVHYSNENIVYDVFLVPATTVYYEEGFASYSDGWTGNASKGTGTQAAQVAGKSTDEYGYDAAYNAVGASNGTQATSSAAGDKATFTFTGTGVDIYANCKPTIYKTETDSEGKVSIVTDENGRKVVEQYGTGVVTVIIIDDSDSIVKFYQVDTAMVNGDTGATENQDVTAYNVPIVSEQKLTYGTYTVTIKHVYRAAGELGGDVNLDGFRVYGTLATEPDFYETDKEDNPTFIELRDQVLAGLSVTSTGDGQVNASVTLPDDAQVAVVASSDKYTEENVNDLLTNGPKNEIYLQPEQALVLTITTDREVQIGLKALNAATTCTINNESKSISTSTDMYYTVSAGNITITNKGDGILSITKLKVCDDPDAALGTLTEDDLTDALVALGIIEPQEPEEPVVTYDDATLNVSLVDYTGKELASAALTENGVTGENASFSAADILAAAGNCLPDGYAIVDEAAVTGAEVAYGEDGTVTVQIGKTATLNIRFISARNGKRVDTATITVVQTSERTWTRVSASEIKALAPAGYRVFWLTNVTLFFGSDSTIVVPLY